MLHKRLRDEVESELGNFLQFDPFVAGRPNNQYFVRSLYFDDPVNSAFYDKIDGLHTRSKFRIRTYTDDPEEDVPQFMEEKGRYNNRVFKHRTPIAPLHIGRGSTAAIVDALLAGQDDDPTLGKFRFEFYRKQIRPVALVDYRRRPYVSRYDPEFRVTFDEKLRGTLTDSLFPPRTHKNVDLLTGYTVMEVKFGHQLPSWFHRIIQSYELRRVSLSKICETMGGLGIAIDLQ